jgi:hypothetical protein
MRRIILAIIAAIAMTTLGYITAFGSVGRPSSPEWSTWNPSGSYQINDTAYVNNNSLGSPMGPQELWVNSASNWGIHTDQPSATGEVLSYPDEQILQYVSISSLTSLYANWNISVPDTRADDYEAAYDIWIQDNGNATDWNNNTELMIWTYNHRHNPPLGSVVRRVTISYDQKFTMWANGGKDKGNVTYTLVQDTNTTSGTTNILAVLRWLIANGWIPRTAGLNDVEFGWEICSTGGVYQNFVVNDYHLQG